MARNISEKYCYWSVATGAYGPLMENCVQTARAAGIVREFHVLTDRPLDGCDCYDAMECEKEHGLFKLHYLKVGMSRLTFEYFVWIDADTVFLRNPIDLLGPLSRAPLHVPLEVDLASLRDDFIWKGSSLFFIRELLQREGVVNKPYLSQSAFWIIHREAIETVYDLAMRFWHKAKEGGQIVDVSVALGYAMQILCADSEKHLLAKTPNLWVSDDAGYFTTHELTKDPWEWRHPLVSEGFLVRPAIIHLPCRPKLSEEEANVTAHSSPPFSPPPTWP